MKVLSAGAAADIRAEAGDVFQLETQYDERRGTVLYVSVNGISMLRIQNLEKDSQILNSPIEMYGAGDSPTAAQDFLKRLDEELKDYGGMLSQEMYEEIEQMVKRLSQLEVGS